MRGYLSVSGTKEGRIPVTSTTRLYRDPERDNQVVAEVEGTVRSLGVADATVSRKTADGAPVSLHPRADCIEIRNGGNTNGVTVVAGNDRFEVAEGFVETVARDATISIGYATELHLAVEREAKVERNVVHEGDGDVVMGDQTNVDRSTTVGDDNVLSRTDVGGGSAEVGDDDVVNRSSVGDDAGSDPTDDRYCIHCGAALPGDAVTCPECGRRLDGDDDGDTRQFCETHQRTYTGAECPDCRRARR